MFAEMFINLWVLLQCACAGACVVLWLLWVVPAIRRSDAPLTTDIWGPAALCAPAFWATSLVELNLHPVGESFIAAPILFAALGVGLSLCVGRSNSRSQVSPAVISRFTLSAWLSGAIVLLLLAALNELSVWVGQTIFAVSIVLLWCQTPSIPEAREAEAETDTRSPAGGFALIAVIILACLQGWAWQRGGIDLFPAGLTVFSIGLAICLVASAMRGGVGGLRLAGAVAIMGPLLGIGILSLGRMLPVAWELSRASAQAPADPPPLYLAFGIGRYALEIALLLGFAGLVGLLPAFAARTTKWIGLGLAAIAFAMIISRIAGWF